MVLRKPVPPRLDNPGKGNDSRESSSPASPTASNGFSSPKRLTRKQARSPPRSRQSPRSPRSPRIPSQESVFSPDLHTSPAFDLMPLEQAQRSPAGGPYNETRNPWTDEWERETPHQDAGDPFDSRNQNTPVNSERQDEVTAEDRTPARIPSVLAAGRNSTHSTSDTLGWEQPSLSPIQLRSNNPFLKNRRSEENPWGNSQTPCGTGGTETWLRDSRATEQSDVLSQSEGYIPMTARLSLLDQPPSTPLWPEEHPASTTQSPSFQGGPPASQGASQNASVGELPLQIHIDQGPAHGVSSESWAGRSSAAMSWPLQSSSDYKGYSNPQQQLQHQVSHSGLSPETGTVPMFNGTLGSSQDLIALDDPLKPEGQTFYRPSSSIYESDTNEPSVPIQPTHVPSTESRPLLPELENSESSEHPPPVVRNAPLSEAEAKRQKEQRAETYSIRHVNWTDASGNLRQSPVLVQNKNGPCPLLALVNSLVISAGKDSQLPIVKALQSREQISLGLLIEALFDELMTGVGLDGEIPDIEALSRFLTMLHTGMNVNPLLTLEPSDLAGTFLQTSDIRLYGTFGVPLLHGWLAPPSSEAHAALKRVAQYHEDIQLLQFRRDELEQRVMQGGALTLEEEGQIRDIYTIQQFVEVENATQLSTFGLEHLTKSLQPGSVAILFRNDHFSTLYKHPDSHTLFTLVTDAGYASHAEIVWESLVDVNGSKAEMFSGDFRPVGHAPSEASGDSASRYSGKAATGNAGVTEQPVPRALSPQEQADADYAYALSLHFQEEEQREASRNNQSNQSNQNNKRNQSNQNNQRARDRSASTPYRPQQTDASRRAQNRFSTPGLNPPRGGLTPHKGEDDEPPPPYEQAAGIRPPVRPQPVRRPHPATVPDRYRDKTKDCVVM